MSTIITVQEYAKIQKVSPQAITARIRANDKNGERLDNGLPNVKEVTKFQRNYQIHYNEAFKRKKAK